MREKEINDKSKRRYVEFGTNRIFFYICRKKISCKRLTMFFYIISLSLSYFLKKLIPKIYFYPRNNPKWEGLKVEMIQFHRYANDRHCANNGGDAVPLDDDKGNYEGKRNESHENINNYVNVVIYIRLGRERHN